MNVRFCPSCQGLVLAEFLYCPYCGQSLAEGRSIDEDLEAPFRKLDAARGGSEGRSPFAKAEESLRRLESDMDLILEELEKEGRSST
jgi:hypothetical protein